MEEHFTKNIFLVATFFLLTPIALATSIFTLLTLNKSTIEKKVLAAESPTNAIYSPEMGVQVYASFPDTLPQIYTDFGGGDARNEILRQYLDKYNSPLLPHVDFLVNMADQYGVDFRLITAIAQQESNLCKKIPENTYNCWGWGIHSKGTLGFSSYEEGIEIVTRGVKQNYIDKGYTTAEEIMSKYTPSSNGSWANGVSSFMAEME